MKAFLAKDKDMSTVRKNPDTSQPSHDRYRAALEFDEVRWATHCVDCYPGNCPMRAYVKDGKVVREEVSGTLPIIDPSVPDYNPMGCMQGTSWSQSLDGPDRAAYPLKRAGERGEGKWEQISWDQALNEIADEVIDAIEEHGPRSVVHDGTPEVSVIWPTGRFFDVLGGFGLDVNASIGDFLPGLYLTYGKMQIESTADDWFQAETILIWHGNPVYTRIPFYHFISEARYNGTEIFNISPDINASHLHADYQVTINGATDAAFALSMVQVILEENLQNEEFIREQTDLALLVRMDTGRYLREIDLTEGGREDQMYQWQPTSGGKLHAADRGNLRLDGLQVALSGTFEVELTSGNTVTVQPVFALLKAHLNAAYTPELQQDITGIHPDTVRMMAHKIAASRTTIVHGANACKTYHGDLLERAECLLLGVTGNWGRSGTGIRGWSMGMMDGSEYAMGKAQPGLLATDQVLTKREEAIAFIKQLDPTMTTELAMLELLKGPRGMLGDFIPPTNEEAPAAAHAPPAFWWYYQQEMGNRWNNSDWGDTSLPRTFDEYMQEALDKGWWQGLDHPRKDEVPQVMIECGSNMIRRTRGGKKAMMDSVWPKLKTIVSIDFRISTTVAYSDYFLPAAQHYEKVNFAFATPMVMNMTLGDKAVEPHGEARSEWEIFSNLLAVIARRAAEKGLDEYTDPEGKVRKYSELPDAFTMNGYYTNEEVLAYEQVRDTAYSGTIPEGTTLEDLRKTGFVRFVDWGLMPGALSQSSPFETSKPHTPLRNHVENGEPYPTYARRAQFYIDHEWFLESGEQLPLHKPNPSMGGDYPLGMTSGHNRWSVHSMNHMNKTVLGTHRGEPSVMVNADDAIARDVKDDDLIRIFNDVSEFTARAKVAPNVKPGQIISYNGWESLQYKNWSGANEIEPGMVKWNGFSGGYGHLNFEVLGWQPIPVDRWLRCDFEPAPIEKGR
jgi:DMSO reductase family type II enzyme molybdopterin subunit